MPICSGWLLSANGFVHQETILRPLIFKGPRTANRFRFNSELGMSPSVQFQGKERAYESTQESCSYSKQNVSYEGQMGHGLILRIRTALTGIMGAVLWVLESTAGNLLAPRTPRGHRSMSHEPLRSQNCSHIVRESVFFRCVSIPLPRPFGQPQCSPLLHVKTAL